MKTKSQYNAGSVTRTVRTGHLARAVVFLLVQALVLQPTALAANWAVAQQPLFTINPVYPNVVFMLDDSWSMNDYRLPPPTFFSFNNRWPVPGNVTVKYGAGTRDVLAHDEFTLRSSVHNPLAYDPAITYTPWNDNDKPQAAKGTRPDRSQNFPPADTGDAAPNTVSLIAQSGRFTERDMRFRDFANGGPNSPRKWVTTSRGSVGGSTGTYATGAAANDKWTWSALNVRWEQPIANPAGTAIYNPLPGDGPQAADIFTNPPVVCTSQPPCIQWNMTTQNQCVQTQPVQTGTTQQCDSYSTVPVFGNVCTQYQQVQTGVTNGACLSSHQQQTGTTNGACLTWQDQDIYQPQTTCQMVTVVDPTSETGYRQVQQCTTVQVFVGTQSVCTSYDQIPVFTQVCDVYDQVPVFGQQCVQWQNQQTGTTQVCDSWSTVPVFQDQCVQWQQVQVQTTCAATDPNWVCPQQNITTDNLTPARYYRYEGSVPATDDDLAVIGNYRLVEVDRAVNQNFPVPVDPRTGAVRSRNDCVAGTTCTLLEEMQNYANWFTYYRHRLFAAMAVTSQAASDLKGDLSALRLAYGRINYFDNGPDPWNPYGPRLNGATFPSLDNEPQPPPHPGAVVRGVRDFTDTAGNPERQEFFDWIFSLNWVGSTPNREAIDSIGNYYLGSGDFGPWSDHPGHGGGRSGDQHAACRRSFTILATDGEWTAIPDNPPIPPAQPLITNRAADPVGAGGGTVTASLATMGPQIQGSGLYQNTSYTYDPAAEPQYSTNGGGGQTLTDVALYWWNRDLRPTVPNAVQKRPNRPDDSFWQSMTTFVVGYGLNASMDTPAVRAQIAAGQAVNWPIVDISPALITGGERINDTMRAALATRGDFYSANDPDQMRGRVRGVFRAIAQQAFSGTGLGTTSAQLTVGAVLYRASFTTQIWTGSLAAYDAMAMASAAKNQTPEPAALWNASFPAWNARNIVTSTGPNSATLFNSFNNLNAQQQTDLVDVDVMDYIRGKKIGLEVSSPLNNQTRGFRDRTTLLGSIVSSSPRYSKAPNFGYQLNPAAGGGATYAQHVSNNQANRKAAVYVGANAGMFHAFDGNPNANQGGGQELFAYVPRSVYPYLSELTNVNYTHRYFVDGPVVEGDVYFNGTWKTVVMGSAGAGPAGLFALDVTRPDQFDQTKVLWDITPAEEPDLGKVLGYGFIGSVKNGQNAGNYVAIVPNGYQSTNNHAVLLIIDMQTGQTLRKIDTCKKNNGVPFAANEQGGRCDPANEINGLANVSVIFDANRNVVGAYSGDYQGNLWKFDLSNSDPTQWRIETEDPNDASGNTPIPLFSAVNGANQRQPIVAAPRAATHPFGGSYVVFGTGKFFEYPDQTSTEVQSIYGLWVKPGDKAPITKAQLLGLGITETTQNNVTTRTLTGTAGFSWRTHRGWYVDLAANNVFAGERVIADPVVERGLLTMTSFQPTSTGDPCAGGGTSYFYAIPMDASLSSIDGTQIKGVVSSILPLIDEAPILGQRSTTLSKNEAEAALQTPNLLRKDDGTFSTANRVLECVKLYNQVNVQTGFVPKDCAGTYPIRTWRPIR